MPLYYFDYHSKAANMDEEGVQLESVDEAKEQLRRSLPEMLRHEHGEDNLAEVCSAVRDEGGQEVLKARLNLKIEHTDDEG